MNREAVVSALEAGVRHQRDTYVYESCHLRFGQRDAVLIDYLAQVGDDMDLDTYEQSSGELPAEQVEKAIAQAIASGWGRLKCKTTFAQRLYARVRWSPCSLTCRVPRCAPALFQAQASSCAPERWCRW